MRRAAALLLAPSLLAAGLAAGGCGNRRQHPPDVARTRRPGHATRVDFPQAGLSFRAPGNWLRREPGPPLVTTILSGRAVVAVWRYPRSQPLPVAPAALEQARLDLVDGVRVRDPAARIETSKVVQVGGAKGVELLASETIDGAPRRVRSTHLYDRGAELVIDAYAPPATFPGVDRTVFRPLVASLKLRAPGSRRR